MELAESSVVPPGFRFHPTEEELVGYYLRRKINSLKIDLDVIIEIDLYRIEPWDIQGKCKLGYEEQNEWYFFSHKDRKYPTGRRTNRATSEGFWKATGRDKAVLSKETIIGMRKTLVFYKGRAPTGIKTDWIMHEYRLQSSEHGPPQVFYESNTIDISRKLFCEVEDEEGWVVCRAFKKPIPNQRQENEPRRNDYYLRNNNNLAWPSVQDMLNPMHAALQNQSTNYYQVPFDHNNSDQQQISTNTYYFDQELTDLPQIDSPSTVSTSLDPDQDKISNHVYNNNYSDMNNAALFSFPNMTLISCDDELDSQNQMNHLLGSYTDL